MFNRSGLFILAIIASFGIPYFMSAEQSGTRSRVAHVWDKMFTDTISDRYPQYARDNYGNPISSASPLPTHRQSYHQPPWEYRPAERVAQFSTERMPQRSYTRNGIVPAPSGQRAVPNHIAAPDPNAIPTGLDTTAHLSLAGPPIASDTYPSNPLQGIAPEQGATEWRTVGPADPPLPGLSSAPQSGAMMSSLPIPHSVGTDTTVTAGQPDKEGWVTVGPAASYSSGTVSGANSSLVPGITQYPSVPPGAQILPGIVIGGPQDATGMTSSLRPQRHQHQPQDISQLLDFENAPDWVMNSWPRVSTHIIQSDLSGMRVPLVSGTNAQDLAGSLSYYFDQSQQLQRVSFEGATGDPTRLIKIVTEAHGLQAEPSLGGGMYVARDSDITDPIESISSALRLRRAPVVRDSRPLQKYLVMLEVNRPDSNRTISKEFARLLQLDRRSQRWTPGSVSAPKRPPVPTDPRDPFSPASPNDAPLPQPPSPKPNAATGPGESGPAANTPSATATPTPAKTTLPGHAAGRGVMPSGDQFQSQSFSRSTRPSQMPAIPGAAATQPRSLKTRVPRPTFSPRPASQQHTQPNPLRCVDPGT